MPNRDHDDSQYNRHEGRFERRDRASGATRATRLARRTNSARRGGYYGQQARQPAGSFEERREQRLAQQDLGRSGHDARSFDYRQEYRNPPKIPSGVVSDRARLSSGTPATERRDGQEWSRQRAGRASGKTTTASRRKLWPGLAQPGLRKRLGTPARGIRHGIDCRGSDYGRGQDHRSHDSAVRGLATTGITPLPIARTTAASRATTAHVTRAAATSEAGARARDPAELRTAKGARRRAGASRFVTLDSRPRAAASAPFAGRRTTNALTSAFART